MRPDLMLLFIVLLQLLPIILCSKAEYKLYKNVLANYQKLVRPVRNTSESLRVEMKVFLQQIMNLDGKNQIIELNAWLKFIWTDYRLAWDPEKYEGITSIRFAGGENQIWRPDVLMYNSANEDFDSTFKSNEVVYHTGEVNWVPPGILVASCKMDITYFPFDDQTCYLKFGSWTYHIDAIDLHIIVEDGETPQMDLSTYTPNGEWHLVSAPAVREIIYSPCCPEPYSTVTFYMHLRRRTIFYLFNIVLPSLLISLMTLMGFCLPAHDMSEKIGYQTTILLSICFFVTIVSEMTPPTSEAVPLLGIFFSTLTLIVSVSTAFTITVLNFRYRQTHNTKMPKIFNKVFLVWIPWLLMMKRPGVIYKQRRSSALEQEDNDSLIANWTECCPSEPDFYFESIDSADTIPIARKPRPLLKKMCSIPTEHLNLERKVGDGILNSSFSLRKTQTLKSRRQNQFQKFIQRSIELAKQKDHVTNASYVLTIVNYFKCIDDKLRALKVRLEKQNEMKAKQEEWKYAALALDRLCLFIFTIFLFTCIGSIIYATPHFDP